MATLEQQNVQPVKQVPPKMKAFGELKEMVKPVPELDYRKELEEARNEKFS